MTKSHVTMEQRVCPVCGNKFATGDILLDTKLRNAFDQYTCTGYSICAACKGNIDNGYIAAVAFDPEKSGVLAAEQTVTLENAHRTGTIAHIKKELWAKIVGQEEMTQEELQAKPFVFVTEDFIVALQKLMKQEN